MTPPTLRVFRARARKRSEIRAALDPIAEVAEAAFDFPVRPSAWRPLRPGGLEHRRGGVL